MYIINPIPNPWFLRVCNLRLLKTLWKKEKLLVTMFSSHLDNFLPFSSNLKLLFVKSLEFGRV